MKTCVFTIGLLFIAGLCSCRSFGQWTTKKEGSAPQQDIGAKNNFSITGRVVDAEGKGIAGARVHLLHWPELNDMIEINATTNDNGLFNLQGIKENAEWLLQINHPGYVEYKRQSIKLSKKDDGMNVVLPAGTKISVKVLFDKSKTPASHYFVQLFKLSDSQPPRQIITTALRSNGEIILERVEPGNYRVAAIASPLNETIEAKSDITAEDGKDISVVLMVPESK
jgi:hypothetical protein